MESIGHWDNNWHSQKCTACSHHGHTAYNCEKKEIENFTVTDAGGTHTARLHAQCYATRAPPGSNTITTKAIHHHDRMATTQYLQRNQTTKQLQHKAITSTSSAGSAVDITQMFVMHLDENRQQTKLIEYRKDLLANVSTYNGKDKKAC